LVLTLPPSQVTICSERPIGPKACAANQCSMCESNDARTELGLPDARVSSERFERPAADAKGMAVVRIAERSVLRSRGRALIVALLLTGIEPCCRGSWQTFARYTVRERLSPCRLTRIASIRSRDRPSHLCPRRRCSKRTPARRCGRWPPRRAPARPRVSSCMQNELALRRRPNC
jgi:hypothetical protein